MLAAAEWGCGQVWHQLSSVTSTRLRTCRACLEPRAHPTNEPEGPTFSEQTEVGAEGPSKKAESGQLSLQPPSGCSRPDTRVKELYLAAACSAST